MSWMRCGVVVCAGVVGIGWPLAARPCELHQRSAFSAAMAAASARHAPPAPWEKVSAPLAETVRGATSARAKKAVAECFVQIRGEPTPETLQVLAGAGFRSRSVIPQPAAAQDGERRAILTGTIRVGDVEAMAGLPFVVAVEGGVPLQHKEGGVGRK
ncbi:MAG: hypothetical protein HY543_13060 [Deltaproteobacteria bacterium]|nr:hypothetical protein [Deltaproteobacteria bacterium]